jgi:serine/threonine-protein kinase
MGVVYKAHDPSLGRTVALKTLRAGTLADPDEVERFYREARAVARLNHPHIVPVFEVGRHDDHHYFCMAFVEGGSLVAHLPRFQADPRAAAALVEKVSRAVHYAHTKGILHRDLKPANILLDERGEPQVSDFGLAKVLDADVELTRTGCVLGTPPYMSPEQSSGRNSEVGPASDVWSLGVVLYELLTGRRPFRAEGREELLRQINQVEPPRPGSLRPDLDPALEMICLRCLEKDPAWRYPSAEALADDLYRWLHGQAVAPRPPRRLARAWRRHSRAALLAGLVLLVAALSALAAVLLSRPGPAPGPTVPKEAPRRADVDDLERRLAGGEAVTLVGEAGADARGTPWFAWAAGESDSSVTADAAGPLRLRSSEVALLALLRAAPETGYRLRAEVRQAGEQGQVGVYFAHHSDTTAGGTVHCFGSLAFGESAAHPPQTGKVALNFCCLRGADSGNARQPRALCAQRPLEPTLAPAGAETPWRRLAVEVTAGKVRALCEGEPLGELARAEADRRLKFLRAAEPGFEQATARLAPGGGLGLYVDQGTASFRRVTVEPIARED